MNNHVNNAVYFTYMENARTELLRTDDVKLYAEGKTILVMVDQTANKPIVIPD